MDTFFEQIVPIKKTAKEMLLIVLIWFLALILAGVLFLLIGLRMFAIGVMAAAFVFYGAYRLSLNFFVEYEYIIVNGDLDIDKIIAKRSRKRILSIDMKDITTVDKYNPHSNLTPNGEVKYMCCDEDDNNAFVLTVSKDNKTTKIVLSPNDRIKEGILKCLPKYIANFAFKV